MSMKVNLPASLRHLAGDATSIQVSGASVKEVFDSLECQIPGFRAKLCDDAGRIRKFAAIIVNGKDIRTLKGIDTPLAGTEEISIVVAIAGG
jgi:molybdopterin synthase sulfur carrier subunit